MSLPRTCSGNKSGFIGIVVKNLSHPFMASLVKHVENNLYTNGYKCMLCEVGDNPNRIEEFVEMLQRNVRDGIICCADIRLLSAWRKFTVRLS